MRRERYPLKRSRYSSHSQIANWILTTNNHEGKPLKLLDIGCSRGEVAELIDSPGIAYEGVEPFSDDYAFAVGLGLNVKQLTAEEAIRQLTNEYDLLVFGDVLEHLVSPSDVLSESRKILSQNGVVLLSVPNVAHFTNRISLFFGNWDYKDRGIRDRTHLKFFTIKTIKEMCLAAGFQIIETSYTPIPIEALANGRRIPFFKYLDYVNYKLTQSAPKLFAYQTLLKLQVLP